jgi:uncharacterized protein YcbK (DUF882 family)
MRTMSVALATFFASIAMAFVASPDAWAEVTHVVQPGHTLEAIAHRYHVTVQAIVDANHLKDTARLKPGQRLVIPTPEGAGHPSAHDSRRAALDERPSPREHAHKGVVVAFRSDEEVKVRVKDSGGRIPSAALKSFEHLMRQGTTTHSPDPRLVALVGIVSDHFGGHPLEVVSGFRAYTPTQYTPHSNHNFGRALDFRIRGVKNEELWAFCRTLRNAGCGYYPNSTFVHMDVRDSKAFWIDRSRPGEPPQYDRPGAPADEGASEVPDDRAAPREESPSPSGAPGEAPPEGEMAPLNAPPAKGSPVPLPGDPSSERAL